MARKIPKEFVPFDFTLPERAQTRRAGVDAELLYYRSLMWLKQHSWTNGFIPADELPVIGRRIRGSLPALAKKLVDVEYWTPSVHDDEEGWAVTSWLAWNPSRDELDEAHAQRVLGAAKTNHNRGRHEDKADPYCPLCQDEGVSPKLPRSVR